MNTSDKKVDNMSYKISIPLCLLLAFSATALGYEDYLKRQETQEMQAFFDPNAPITHIIQRSQRANFDGDKVPAENYTLQDCFDKAKSDSVIHSTILRPVDMSVECINGNVKVADFFLWGGSMDRMNEYDFSGNIIKSYTR